MKSMLCKAAVAAVFVLGAGAASAEVTVNYVNMEQFADLPSGDWERKEVLTGIADYIKKLGADHVINYKETPSWGEEAAKLTPGNAGVQHVVEVGGPTTMAQSLKAIGIDGVISIIGFIGGMTKDQPTFLDCLNNICTVRGVLVGSRLQMEDMCRAIEQNDIHPIVDEKVFGLKELKEAYQYMWEQKHFGKLTVRVAE